MNGELQVVGSNQYAVRSCDEIKNNASLIKEILTKVLKKGVHYDLPYAGAEKPSLLKAGAEKILSTFMIGSRLRIEDLSTDDCRRFRVITEAFHIPTGTQMGEGVGECSTDEKKFKWVKAVCKEEFDEADPSRRQLVWKKGRNGNANHQEMQVRSNPADLSNTVLKMAKKRSVNDLCLAVTAASDCFDTDLDNDESGNREFAQRQAESNLQQPQEKKNTPPPPPAQDGKTMPSGMLITEKQGKRLFAILKNSDKSDQECADYLWTRFGIASRKDITMNVYEEIINWIQTAKETANAQV
jgi:hypothetical protein